MRVLLCIRWWKLSKPVDLNLGLIKSPACTIPTGYDNGAASGFATDVTNNLGWVNTASARTFTFEPNAPGLRCLFDASHCHLTHVATNKVKCRIKANSKC